MAAVELLSCLAGLNPSRFSRREIFLVEAKLFALMCDQLKEMFRIQHRDYFRLMKFSIDKENTMLESNFVRFVLNDILSTEEYTLSGIAYYTDTPEDVIHDVINGRNVNPSAMLLRRSIDLHRSVRRDLYHEMMKKVALEYWK